MYLQECGTVEQKQTFLPRLASGALGVSHADHEQGNRTTSTFETVVRRDGTRLVLSGIKHWVTNAAHAELVVVIARGVDDLTKSGALAVLVDPSRRGVIVGDELPRPGIHGISLASVVFDGYEIAGDNEILGGLDADIDGFITRFEPGSSLGFAARAVGAGQAAVADLYAFLARRPSAGSADAIIDYRVGEVAVRLSAMEAVLERVGLALGPPPSAADAHIVKVFCSEELQRLVADCMMIKGGAPYAEHPPS